MVEAATASAPSRTKRSPAALREPRPRKREKYARMACSLCKVRKVKCSGNQPCSRCEELHSECTYNEQLQPDTENFDPQPAYQDLEYTVLRMNRICDQMQQSMGRFGLSHPRGPCLQRKQGNDELPQPSKPLIPTDLQCSLHLTGDTLRARDLQSPPDSKDGNVSVTGDEDKSSDALITLLQAARPILELGHQRITQLVTIFKDEVYPIYPCISLNLGYDTVNALFSLLTYASQEATHGVDRIDVEITKSVVAIALLVGGDTQSPLAFDLEGHLVWSVDSCFDQEHTQVEDILMATLLSIYLELKQRPVKAWRMSGVAARLCLELGLHREKFFEDLRILPQRITDWKRLFACVYRVDRKCSLYSGLPWTLHDEEIDMSAIQLEPQESYLSTMISLDRNLSELWSLINSSSSQLKVNDERLEFLGFQLQKLVDNMPTEDFKSLEPTVDPPPWLQAELKWFCRLRVHHIKLLNRIGASGSLRNLVSQPKSAAALVPLAIQSVDLHQEMVNAHKISPLLLPTAMKLLLSSLSIMLLVVSHFPEEYGPMCSKPFQTAIDILRDVKSSVKNPDLNFSGILAALAKVTESSQSSHSQWSAPLINRKEGSGNTVYHGVTFGQVNVFDELSTPNSEIFSMLGDVSMAATDILHIDNLFG